VCRIYRFKSVDASLIFLYNTTNDGFTGNIFIAQREERIMGVKRMETRLITEYVNERIKNLRLQQKILIEEGKLFLGSEQDAKLFKIEGAMQELSSLYDILGGFNE
jgi:hypothetical protein